MDLDPRLLKIIACPKCMGRLFLVDENLRCDLCGEVYLIDEGIPVLITQPNTTEGFDYRTHYTLDSEKFDYFEERTGATAHSERRVREYILSLVPKNSESVLDVGCGSAWVAKAFQKSSTFLCSLDISSVNPRKALERYPSPNHVGVAADTYHLPFANNSFDTIIASEIIEHLHDPNAFAAELLRVVKPNGTVVVSTPYKEKLVYELCIHCHQMTPHNAHLWSWDEPKLRALFADRVNSWQFAAFNNKLLLFGRTYPILKLFPFGLWKTFDKIANSVINRPVNCIMKIVK